MAFTGNGLENIRLVDQAVNIIVGQLRDMRGNANAHLAMAAAQNPAVTTLASYVNDCAAQYQLFLARLNTALTVDPTKTKMLDGLARQNCASTDITTPGTTMNSAAVALGNASKTTYAEITTALNNFLAAIPAAPASVWPE
jgi:hypothetical protein